MLDFVKENPQYVAKDNAMDFLSNDGGRTYSLCHCESSPLFSWRRLNDSEQCEVWSNFEIADMNLWRTEAYTKYFDHLDASGGFYYEVSVSDSFASVPSDRDQFVQRWGDAVVHSVAAGLFQSKDQIHFFKDIGYQHDFFAHCPEGADWANGKCACNPKDNFGGRSCRYIFRCPSNLILWYAVRLRIRFRSHSVLVSPQVADGEPVISTPRCDPAEKTRGRYPHSKHQLGGNLLGTRGAHLAPRLFSF